MSSIAACIAIDDTLNRHFAVLGTTGVGKSTAVALLLRKAIEARPDLRVLILDPHNEFAPCAARISPSASTPLARPAVLAVPAGGIRRGSVPRPRDRCPRRSICCATSFRMAKHSYRNPGSARPYLRRGGDDALTADTPVPYRMADLLKLIDERMGMLETKNDRPVYRALRNRIEAAVNDPRYRFMFHSRLIEDTIHETIGKIFRVPHQGKQVTCFEMAGMPSEVVNSVCSVLARLAFDLALLERGQAQAAAALRGGAPLHAADPRLGFAPTRHAMSRIAKEGRKYGCYLGVVSQRPGELDPTILSQCSTVFAMRLANEQDQAIIRSAIADSSASTLSFLSSMGQREAIAFGEGVATTMRMKFEKMAGHLLAGRGKKRPARTSPARPATSTSPRSSSACATCRKPSTSAGSASR